jgi:hypothetical protein
MIEEVQDHLREGKTLAEAAVAMKVPLSDLEELQKSDLRASQLWEAATLEAYMDDVQELKDNIKNPKFNTPLFLAYMTNRWGWSMKPGKLTKPVKDANELLQAILGGKVDVDLGLTAIKAVAAHIAVEDGAKLKSLIEELENVRERVS